MQHKPPSFEELFHALTGNSPFPWQRALYDRFVSDGDANIPSSCNLPTGLGKTSVVAIWLIAWANSIGKLPRRLVYVVNRRTVVDQTTDEVEKIRRNLVEKPELEELRKLVPSLAISTLRGQFADNREWSADPSRPAVICGTVDMIGSRLLFSGYGVGFKAKPLHAGFLGQDVLLVHDEAHLEPAFQKLLIAIEKEQKRCNEFATFRVMELSATSRKVIDGPDKAPFTLSDRDRTNPEVKKRIEASKTIHLHENADGKKLAGEIAELALTFTDTDRAVLVFVRKVEDVEKVVKKLPKDSFEQLTGTLRGLERDGLVKKPIFQRFLPESNRDETVTPADGTVYLVCTSAGEVGVNLSADHLVCDLTTFESMAQRFGRVNRFGDRKDTEIHVVHPQEFDKNDDYESRLEKTLELLRQLNGDGSPQALNELPPEHRLAAFAPEPTILPATDILFDSWALTTIRGKLPGRPPVEPYLHGIAEWDPPQTQVAWREEVGVIVDELLETYPPQDLLDEYPLKPHELLRDRTDRVWKELAKLAGRSPQAHVWILDDQGKIDVRKLDELVKLDKKQAEGQLGGRTILLPHNVGGLTAEGMLSGDEPPPPKLGDEPRKINNDVAGVLTDVQGRRLRARVWSNDAKPENMRLILRIDIPASEDDEDAELRSWHWFELPAPTDNSKNAIDPVRLKVHVGDVEKRANAIVAHLPLDEWIKQAVVLAARFHDLGKRRELWQRGIGRPSRLADIWFAKSGRGWKTRDVTAYRHEFGSLVDLQSLPEFQSLDDDAKDLVQHLIAAHHGQARPHFSAVQIIDANSTTAACEALAVEIPRRYARLQRKYGRWGLAYLESILRAADWAASAEPSAFFKDDAR